MKKTAFIITIFIVLNGLSVLQADTIWRDRNIYASTGNIAQGDVIVVDVMDLSQYKFNMKHRDNTVSDIQSNPDVTITGFLPKVSQNKNFKNNTSTGFEGNTKIAFSIASQVTNVGNNGVISLTGSRTYSLNGTTTTVTVSGNASARMIKAGTISSDKVANFTIAVRSRKDGVTITKKQIQNNETANSQLTEQEKQRLIIDYIEKIIREMTR